MAINELASLENSAYLLKYDSVYGQIDASVETKEGTLIVQGSAVRYFSEKDPRALPWKSLNIDVVVEATGHFADFEKAGVHLEAGAKKVVITAPVKGQKSDLEATGSKCATILRGINCDSLPKFLITSNASCTTNAAAPVIAILDAALGIEKAILSTVHAQTASQSLVDSPNGKDMREGRAAGANIVPTSTGAAIAVTEVIPSLAGKFDGISLRVPVLCGSIADITFISKKDTSVAEVNDILRKAAKDPHWEGIFSVTDEPLVSSDIIGVKLASIADLSMTRVVAGTLVKVLAWYDNEAGYAHTLVEHVVKAGRTLK